MQLKHALMKLSLASVLGAALLAGACSEQGTQPDLSSLPSDAQFAKGGNRKYEQVRLTASAPVLVTADIDRNGGLLQAGNHFLYVPEGAVRQRTQFTMEVGTDGVVTLQATLARGNGKTVDVGEQGFREKLTLAIYYGGSAAAIADEANLQVAWVQENGALAAVPSVVNTHAKMVYGQLSHFSQYALASTRDYDSEF